MKNQRIKMCQIDNFDIKDSKMLTILSQFNNQLLLAMSVLKGYDTEVSLNHLETQQLFSILKNANSFLQDSSKKQEPKTDKIKCSYIEPDEDYAKIDIIVENKSDAVVISLLQTMADDTPYAKISGVYDSELMNILIESLEKTFQE